MCLLSEPTTQPHTHAQARTRTPTLRRVQEGTTGAADAAITGDVADEGDGGHVAGTSTCTSVCIHALFYMNTRLESSHAWTHVYTHVSLHDNAHAYSHVHTLDYAHIY